LPRAIRAWQVRGAPNVIFVWIPKNAGQHISLFLQKNFGMLKLKSTDDVRNYFVPRGAYTFGHMDVSRLAAESIIDPAFAESAFVFAVSRNPYTRFASLYRHHRSLRVIPEEATLQDFVRMAGSPRLTPIGLYNGRSLSFCNPQVRWVENLRVDFFGALETIADDMAQIARRIGRGRPVGALPGPYDIGSEAILATFDDAVIAFINEFYAEDFAYFGYSPAFEDRNLPPHQPSAAPIVAAPAERSLGKARR
jgi:hypothetical protein